MIKLLIPILLLFSSIWAEDAATFMKERKEIQELKKELSDFYNKKEEEYKKRQAELQAILSKIEAEKKAIEDIKAANEAILKDIEGTVASKTSKIYNKMKPKVAADIFNQMVADGKIEEVFDIILKLKEKKVTQILKFLDLESASMLTQMLQAYKNNTVKEDNG